jgi:hypothetical protein
MNHHIQVMIYDYCYLSRFTTEPSNDNRIDTAWVSLKFISLSCFNCVRLGIRLSRLMLNSFASSIVSTSGLGCTFRVLISFIFLNTSFSADIILLILLNTVVKLFNHTHLANNRLACNTAKLINWAYKLLLELYTSPAEFIKQCYIGCFCLCRQFLYNFRLYVWI